MYLVISWHLVCLFYCHFVFQPIADQFYVTAQLWLDACSHKLELNDFHVCSVDRTQNVQFGKQTLWLMSVGVDVSQCKSVQRGCWKFMQNTPVMCFCFTDCLPARSTQLFYQSFKAWVTQELKYYYTKKTTQHFQILICLIFFSHFMCQAGYWL